jgi:simple sugar transport system ATP-binding protein
MTDRLALSGITKRYPSVVANDAVSLRVAPGEIRAVLGENGAGKSTLMKVIYGAVRPDAGEIRFDGTPVVVRTPQEARRLGVSMVFQHFSLFETVTVAENVWLGLDRSLSLAQVAARIRAKAGEYGLEIDPERPVHTLSVGERQRVEIVRALLTDPRLLILDEPTSVLTPQAVERLFVTLRQLAGTGCSILYISHKLDEIRALCSACTVMRAGKVTGVVDPRQETNASLSRLMLGAEPPALQHRPSRAGAVALAVRGLSLPRLSPFGVDLAEVGLELRAGEVLGIAGVSGNGQQELLAALSGEDPRAPAAAIELLGEQVGGASPGRRRDLGLHFVPEERLGRGAVPTLMQMVGSAVLFAIFFAVLNTMIMAGRERTKDIGILKALGFTDATTAMLLIGESLLLCALGALLGAGLGVVLEPAFQATVSAMMPGFGFDKDTLLLGAGLALAIGLVSGVVPGIRAAKLTAVAALKEIG